MPAEWTTPITWEVDQLVSAADLNEQVRDNLEFLKSPPTGEYTLDETSDYSTTSSSFVDIDATNLAVTLETAGGDVLVHFHGAFYRTTGGTGVPTVYLDISVDGTRNGGDDGILGHYLDTGPEMRAISFSRLIRGLSAESHTFKLQWKMMGSTNTTKLAAGAGASGKDIHPQFWVREVS